MPLQDFLVKILHNIYITEQVLLMFGDSIDLLSSFFMSVCSPSLVLVVGWCKGLLSADLVVFSSCEGELQVDDIGENRLGDSEFLDGIVFGVMCSPVFAFTGIELNFLIFIFLSSSLDPPALDFKLIVSWDSSSRTLDCSFLFSSSSCKI